MEPQEKMYSRIRAGFDKQAFLKLFGAGLEHVEKGTVVISCRHKEIWRNVGRFKIESY